MRIICLDIGTKRIGVAASDPFGWTAQGITVIERRGIEKDLRKIAEICDELDAKKILIGLPLDAEGAEGVSAKKIREFELLLRKDLTARNSSIDIEMWDERYSTAEAEDRLIEANVSRAKRKRVIDKMAAAVILEGYLEAHQIDGSDEEELS